jgi:hypothetical protein
LNRGVSDHSPALVSVGTLKSFGPKPFKFFIYWLEHKDFLNWIKEGLSIPCSGVPMFPVYRKLKSVKTFEEQEC